MRAKRKRRGDDERRGTSAKPGNDSVAREEEEKEEEEEEGGGGRAIAALRSSSLTRETERYWNRRLRREGYGCRLSTEVLREWGEEEEGEEPLPEGGLRRRLKRRLIVSPSLSQDGCAVFDKAFPREIIDGLRLLLGPKSTYWSSHGYSTSPLRGKHYEPSPFFSYVTPLPLRLEKADTVIGQLACLALRHLWREDRTAIGKAMGLMQHQQLDDLATSGLVVEFWAHCRVPSVGHQMHFDAADEGGGSVSKVQTPLYSSVLYLSSSKPGGSYDALARKGAPVVVAGSTLVTELRREECGRLNPSNKGGYLFQPFEGRYIMFKGDLLHGVLPSALTNIDPKSEDDYRISLMLAFWRSEDMEVKAPKVKEGAMKEGKQFPHAAMAIPQDSLHNDWISMLKPVSVEMERQSSSASTQDNHGAPCIRVDKVWTNLEAPGLAVTQLPPYDCCFQGQ